MRQDGDEEWVFEGDNGINWQWIIVVTLLTLALLSILRDMMPSKGADCPEGEVCGE